MVSFPNMEPINTPSGTNTRSTWVKLVVRPVRTSIFSIASCTVSRYFLNVATMAIGIAITTIITYGPNIVE